MPPLPNKSNIGAKNISVVVVVAFFLSHLTVMMMITSMIIPYYSYHLSVPKLVMFTYFVNQVFISFQFLKLPFLSPRKSFLLIVPFEDYDDNGDDNDLIFTMIMTTMMFLDDDEDSILNPILPWANSSNIGARRNREGSNITAAASNKSFTKNI